MPNVTDLPLIRAINIEKSGVPYRRTMEGKLDVQLDIDLEQPLEYIEKLLINLLPKLRPDINLEVYRGGNHVKAYFPIRRPYEDFNNQELYLMIADTPIY